MFSSLTRQCVNRLENRRPKRGNRRHVNAARLSLEALEDRTLLSANVTNLGLDAISDYYQIDGDLTAFTVREGYQGNADLNGDGDLFDSVLHIYDAASDTTTNLGLASLTFRLDGNLLAFVAFEGQTDLNGDGDATDFALHVYDAATGTMSNLGLSAVGELELNGSLLAFTVHEIAQGTDLNGDGDMGDIALHVYDASTGTTTNLGLAILPYSPSFHVGGNLVVFSVPEGDQGNTDLNADGDTTDTGVTHVYNATTGVTTNLGLDAPGSDVSGDLVAFSVREAYQGNTDLNGDGDAVDSVVHVYDPVTDEITNLEVGWFGVFWMDGSVVAFTAPAGIRVYDATSGVLTNLGLNPNGQWSPIVGGRFAFNVHEGAAGNIDLNGDGDTTDPSLIFVYDTATGVLTGLGLNGYAQVSAELVTFTVSESYHGDLNADGDTSDSVLHVHDLSSGITTNLGLVGLGELDGEMVAFRVYESSQGNTDLNGDGDTSDRVLHVYDAATGVTTNLGLAGVFNPRLSGNRVAFAVSEADQGNTDLNSDGDTLDTVMHVVDFSVQTVDIDIQPHNDANMLNAGSNGMISVAILTDEDFDAAQIDIASVQFAGAFADHAMLHDVDHDGDLDMVLYFRVQDTVLDEIYAQLVEDDLDADGILDSNHQTAEVTLTGETLDDSLFQGTDTMDLFLTGRKLRDLLDELVAAQLL